MIFIASPCGLNTLHRNFIECREDSVRWLQEYGYQVMTKLFQSVSVSMNRNDAIFEANARNAEWLIFIDTDMEFTGCDIHQLIHNGGDVVTGVCKTGDGTYALYEYDDSTNGISDVGIRPIVDICGGAFLGIRGSVVKSMCHKLTHDIKWERTQVRDTTLNFPFNLVTNMVGAQFGEDVSFCLRLRELGIPIHVAQEAIIGHEKIVCIK